MTVQTLRDTMPNLEYHQWRAFFAVRDAFTEKELDKARRRGR